MASHYILFLALTAILACQVGTAKPQPRGVVLNIAAGAVPKWKLDVYGEFAELGARLGDKSKPINTSEDLDKVIVAAEKLWAKYLQNKDKWNPKKLLNKEAYTRPPTTAIYMLSKLRGAITKCNYQGYTELVQAYDAAVGQPDPTTTSTYLDGKDQVKSAVITAISLHGHNCRSTYYNKYDDIYKNAIHEHMLALMDYLFDREFMSKVFAAADQRAPQRVSPVSVSNTGQNIVSQSDLLLEKLIGLVEKTQYKQSILNIFTREFTTEITEPLLVQPCREFTEDLDDIFYPAMIDLALDDGKISEINPRNDKRFIDIWRKFIICKAIEQNSEEVDKALRQSAFMRMQPSSRPAAAATAPKPAAAPTPTKPAAKQAQNRK